MPITQISGIQIQDQSVTTDVFAPESIDGNIIINGTITNEKINTVDAVKVLITDTSNNFTSTTVEDALNETSQNLKNVSSDVQAKINNEVSTLNSTISLNKSDIESKLAVKSNELQINIDNANSVISANKADIEGKLGTELNNLTSIISSNKTNIENKLASEVLTLNTTISGNKADIENKLTTQVNNLEGQISVLNSNVTGNVSQQISVLEKTKADLNGNVAQNFGAKTVTVTGDIMPTSTKTQNIGSATNRFKSIYVDEAYLSTNTLYLGDTAVMGTDASTINIKADVDQSINIKTSGVGQTILTSYEGVQVSTNGMNADVDIKASGAGSNVKMSATREVALTAPNIGVTGDLAVTGNTQVQGLVVGGNLTVKGQVVEVQATTVQVADNIIEINKGEVGNGVTAGQSGIRVDRGQAVDYMIVFDETDDMFKVGMQGGLETIASQPWVQSNMYVHPASHPATMIVEDSTHRFVTDIEKNKLQGVEENANKYVHPDTHPATMIIEDSTHRFITDAEKLKIQSIEVGATNYVHPDTHPATMIVEDNNHRFMTDSQISYLTSQSDKVIPVTASNNGLMIASDKSKLDGISAGAEVNQNAYCVMDVNGINIPASLKSDTLKITSGTNISINTDVATKTIIINNDYSYVHPATHPASIITEDATHRFFTDTERTKLSNCKRAMSGSSNFSSFSAANTITLPIAMADTSYAVQITPTAATNGNLGEVWVIKNTGTITVYNSGSCTGSFDWIVLY